MEQVEDLLEELSLNQTARELGTGNRTESLGMSDVISKLKSANPTLAERLEEYLARSSSAGAVVSLLSEGDDRMGDIDMQIENEEPGDMSLLVSYNDLLAPLGILVDELIQSFSLEDLVEILEVGTDTLTRSRRYLQLQAAPAMYDEWGVDDETFLPDEADEEEGYRDDELAGDEMEITAEYEVTAGNRQLEEGWENTSRYAPLLQELGVTAEELVDRRRPTVSDVDVAIAYHKQLVQDKERAQKRIASRVSHFSDVENAYLRKQLVGDQEYYDEYTEYLAIPLPSFAAVLEGPVGGNYRNDAVRVLYGFLSVLIEKLQSE